MCGGYIFVLFSCGIQVFYLYLQAEMQKNIHNYLNFINLIVFIQFKFNYLN